MSLEKKKRKLNRLGKCDVCRSVNAIYTCPRCEAVTCSLACVKSHKSQLDCDGVRVRTKFVPLDKMDEHTVLSDYRLLEDISRCVEDAETEWPDHDKPKETTYFDESQKELFQKNKSYPRDRFLKRIKFKKEQLFKTMRRGGNGKEAALETLTKAALSKGVILNILPPKFQKHSENTSFFLQNGNCIYWYIKISFLNVSAYTLSLNKCAETMTLENIIKGCLKRSHHHSKKLKIKDPLEDYKNMGLSKMSVLLAVDGLPNCQRKFYQLDKTKTLQENFSGKCIIEYPHLCVMLRDCFDVSIVKDEIIRSNFFEYDEDLEGFEDKAEDKNNETRKDDEKKQSKKKMRKKANSPYDGESDRESGELSSDSNNDYESDSDETNSEDEELFKESEFRSIYTDLLKSFTERQFRKIL